MRSGYGPNKQVRVAEHGVGKEGFNL